jgi:uncharacterized protein (TIGR03067 family)
MQVPDGARLVFERDKVQWATRDRQWESDSYVLDPSRKPIDLRKTRAEGNSKPKDRDRPGIYRLQGRTLFLCLGVRLLNASSRRLA